jgi:enamine deaminase RidA (YjgF/YER057c/UK114 family)
MADLLSRLKKLGLSLPEAPKPVASYVPAVSVHSGHLVFVSGQIPIRDGEIMATGAVPEPVSIERARECARQCVLNGLACLAGEIGDMSRLRRVVRLEGFVACGPGFPDQPKVINGASDMLIELLGEDGRHSRMAVGVPALPLNVPVEIGFTFLID